MFYTELALAAFFIAAVVFVITLLNKKHAPKQPLTYQPPMEDAPAELVAKIEPESDSDVTVADVPPSAEVVEKYVEPKKASPKKTAKAATKKATAKSSTKRTAKKSAK